jgi:hypothetical protein
LPRDFSSRQRRLDGLELADESIARLVVNGAAGIRTVILKTGNRFAQYSVVFSHLPRSAADPLSG